MASARIPTLLAAALALGLACAARGETRTPPELAGAPSPNFLRDLAVRLGRAPEWARMVAAIVRGQPLGPNVGWYREGRSLADWRWLAPRLASFKPEPGSREETWVNRWLEMLEFHARGLVNKPAWEREVARAAHRPAPPTGPPHPQDREVTVGPKLAVVDRLALFHRFLEGELGSLREGPEVGEPAPDFDLYRMDGNGHVHLAELVPFKPTVLIFGSFSCGPFRSQAVVLERLYRQYNDVCTFLTVYQREAHPTDGWRMPINDNAGVSLRQHRSFEERTQAAHRFCRATRTTVPVLVDEMDDRVAEAYSGSPGRLYLIDRAGRVIYKGGRGPVGLSPDEVEQMLLLFLLKKAMGAE